MLFASLFAYTPCLLRIAEAQQPGKIVRIGFLGSSTASGIAVRLGGFQQELSKLGWIEGKNITIEYRFAEDKGTDRFPELAAELVRLKVDLIVVQEGHQSVRRPRMPPRPIPIVMVDVGRSRGRRFG